MEFKEEHIDQFLEGTLEAELRTQFEAKLASDLAFKNDVELHSLVRNGIEEAAKKDLKARLKVIHEEEINQVIAPPETGPRLDSIRTSGEAQVREIPSLKFNWMAAASIALIVGMAAWLFFPKASSQHQDLFAGYYKPYEADISTRGEVKNAALEEANRQYQQKNYANALPLFQQYFSRNPGDPKVLLATGICMLETGQYKEAITTFSMNTLKNNSVHRETAEWYKALCYLKSDEDKAAVIQAFKSIANSSSPYQKDAATILTGLEE